MKAIQIKPRHCAVILACTLLAACAPSLGNKQSSPSIPQELGQYAVVNSKDASFKPDLNTRFAWAEKPIVHYGKMESARPGGLKMVADILTRKLHQQQYRIAHHSQGGQYRVQAIIVVGNTLHESTLDKQFNISPQLGGNDVSYQRGSLILQITKPASGRMAWRGAVQIYTDPSTDLSVARQRVTHAIDALVSNMPELK